MEAIIDTRLRASVRLHDVMNGLLSGRGMRMMILELIMAHELVRVDQDPLFLVFLDLQNAYDTVDHVCLLMTLDENGAGPYMYGLIATFWEQ